MVEWTKVGEQTPQTAVEWTKVDEQIAQAASPSENLPSEPVCETSGKRERPIVVTAMAAYEWLKAALFVQIFWNLWSAPSHSLAASSVNLPSGTGPSYSIFLLLAVALFFVVLGWGLWNLQKWSLVLIMLFMLLDLPLNFYPEFFGLKHTADWLLSDESFLVFLGIAITDLIAFIVFVNRETYRAFNAEDEAKILWWLFWWTR